MGVVCQVLCVKVDRRASRRGKESRRARFSFLRDTQFCFLFFASLSVFGRNSSSIVPTKRGEGEEGEGGKGNVRLGWEFLERGVLPPWGGGLLARRRLAVYLSVLAWLRCLCGMMSRGALQGKRVARACLAAPAPAWRMREGEIPSSGFADVSPALAEY